MDISLRHTVHAFINSSVKYSRYSVSTYKNLFGLSRGIKEYTFLSQFAGLADPDKDINCEEIVECIPVAVRESIKSYNQSKQTAINIYKDYLEFIKGKYKLEISCDFPPIAIWISLERQLYIAKLLQDRNIDIEQLSDMLLVSERTIEEDIRKLRGNDGDPLQVMGQKLIVDMERDRRGIRFPSTVHPFFLTMNLTQVIAILRGLEHEYSKPGFEKYSFTAAAIIWSQLSEYARTRILTVGSELLNLDVSWFNKLNEAIGNSEYSRLFYSERQCSGNDGCGYLLACLKNGMRCNVEYRLEDGKTCFLKNVSVKRYTGTHVICEVDGEDRTLDLDKIEKSSDEPEGLV